MTASRLPKGTGNQPGKMSVLVDRFERGLRAEVDKAGTVIRFGSTELTAVDVLRNDPDAYDSYLSEWREDSWAPEQRAILDDIWSREPANAERFRLLAQAVRKDLVIPFVGSGMSLPFKYPLWRSFLYEIRRKSDLSEADLDAILKRSYEEAAEAILAKMKSANLWDERFKNAFGPKDPKWVGNVEAPVQWLPSVFSGSVITTNYDPVLEGVYTAAGAPFDRSLSGPEVQEFRQRVGDSQHILVKIHGDYARRSTRVLTRAEYDRAYQPGSEARGELERFFTNGSLLFLGCSLSQDRTMEVLHELVTKDSNMPPHYALIPAPTTEAEQLEREHFLADRKIFPIWYYVTDPAKAAEHNAALEALLGMLALESGKI